MAERVTQVESNECTFLLKWKLKNEVVLVRNVVVYWLIGNQVAYYFSTVIKNRKKTDISKCKSENDRTN